MAGLDNLKPFKKGKDPRRNLKGRPVLPDISEAIAAILSGSEDEKLALKHLLKAQAVKAAKGDTKAIEFLAERGYGKPKQPVEFKGEVSQKVIIERHVKKPDADDNTQ